MKTRTHPHIVIDASDIDRPSGVRTAVLELFRALFAQETTWQFSVIVSRYETAFQEFPQVRQIVIPHTHRLLERIWIQYIITRLMVVSHVDIVHFARTIGGVAWPAKSILTIFDLTTLHLPHLHSRSAVWFWRHIQPWLIHQSDLVIAISHTVAQDLVQTFHLSPEKVEVIPCAPQSIFHTRVTPQMLQALQRKYNLPKHYLLFVGMLARKKNLPTLIRALHILKKRGTEFPPLIIAGRRYRQSDASNLFDLVDSLGLTNKVIYLGPVEDTDLPTLYTGATLFVYPSLHEGFGITCLEAMLCHVPVITTRSGAIPEIVGDAALMVDDPLDAEALAYLIQKTLNDPALREKLVAKGIRRAAQFSWSDSAQRLSQVYRHLL